MSATRPEMESKPQQSKLSWLLRAAIASLLLSAPRAVLVLARFGELQPSLDELAGFGALQSMTNGLLLTIPTALFAVVAIEWALRGGRRGSAWLFLALVTLAGFAFVTFRLPHSSLYAPGWDTGRGQVVQVVALLAALVASWILFPRSRVPGLRVLGGLSLSVALACPLLQGFGSSPTANWPERPNVILISLDTLRPDRLESYGYNRRTSPNIARFFDEAWRFEQVLAPDAWTLTCHVSMLTGLEPSAHGVDDSRGLAPAVPTLATHMLDAGYTTMAIVDDCPWVDARYGLGRGFELYRTVDKGAEEKIAQSIELMETAADRPFLMFLHCYDAHSDFAEMPYESAPEFEQEFASSYAGSLTGLSADGSSGASAYMGEQNDRGEQPSPAEQAWISDLYDAGIATLDRDLAKLFEYLESNGRLENTDRHPNFGPRRGILRARQVPAFAVQSRAPASPFADPDARQEQRSGASACWFDRPDAYHSRLLRNRLSAAEPTGVERTLRVAPHEGSERHGPPRPPVLTR